MRDGGVQAYARTKREGEASGKAKSRWLVEESVTKQEAIDLTRRLTKIQTINLIRFYDNPGTRSGGGDEDRLVAAQTIYKMLMVACAKFDVPIPSWLPRVMDKPVTATDHRGVQLVLMIQRGRPTAPAPRLHQKPRRLVMAFPLDDELVLYLRQLKWIASNIGVRWRNHPASREVKRDARILRRSILDGCAYRVELIFEDYEEYLPLSKPKCGSVNEDKQILAIIAKNVQGHVHGKRARRK